MKKEINKSKEFYELTKGCQVNLGAPTCCCNCQFDKPYYFERKLFEGIEVDEDLRMVNTPEGKKKITYLGDIQSDGPDSDIAFLNIKWDKHSFIVPKKCNPKTCWEGNCEKRKRK